jgi:hypothetical protein
MAGPDHRPPHDCPVCGDTLSLTRLSCSSCGTELSGAFHACEFCALNTEERELLRVFLASRGNTKELERHLGVSYPTARARFDGLLATLGIERPAPDPQVELLESLARGDLDVDEALKRLS